MLLLLSGSKSEIMRHNFGTYLLPLPLELALDAYNSYYNYDGLSSHTLMNKKFLIWICWAVQNWTPKNSHDLENYSQWTQNSSEELKRTKMGSPLFWHPIKRQLPFEHGLINHSPSGVCSHLASCLWAYNYEVYRSHANRTRTFC